MKTRKQIWRQCQSFGLCQSRRWRVALAVALVGGAALTSCQKYDLDQKTPEGYGASIYSWLDEQGNFTKTVRLINELNYRDVLDKTGSKTFFAANDEAFDRFFQKNDWGVKSYEDLSMAQKRMLLFGAMIDNSYQVQALSSTEGPIEGNCMRRESTQSIYDTVQVMHKEQVPDGIYWKNYQDRDLVMMHDMTPTPMIHFIERHMANKQITNDDYNFLFNNTTNRQSGDASVNGAQIIQQNIKCMNGFVNQTSEVITPLSNMADIINSKKNTTVFARLLKRYSVPDYCGDDVTRAYNLNRGTQVDSVFQLRYFAKRSQGGEFTSTHNQKSEPNGELKFDPGWNSYYIPTNTTAETALQQDMAVMLVPTDDAINDYWENGAGATLKKNFGSWENVPYSTLTEFMDANMLPSFVSSVPSKFNFILNDASDPMGLTKEHIDSVWLACNGAIYLTNHVFTPTSFVSVMYPTVVDQNMSIIYWAIKQLNFEAYLNSLNATYSFFLPSNDAMLEYIDPASYGKPQQQMLRFHYDPKRKNQEVYASIHNIDPEDGTVGDSIGVYNHNVGDKSLDWDIILNRLYYILNDHVVIGNVEDGHEFYRTKGGSTIRVQKTNLGVNGMTVEGSRQVNGETPAVKIDEIYDQTDGGNGKTYIMNQGPLLGSRKTVFNILGEHPEFARFRELLEGSDLLETIHDGRYACSDTCISVFNNFHYTIYVPTNESIDALIATHQLPTWDDVAVLDTMYSDQKDLYVKYSNQINNFLRYHIQDNSLFIGADNVSANATLEDDGTVTKYETAYIYSDPDPKKDNKTFKRLEITTDVAGSFIDIKDEVGNTRHVMTEKPGLFNLMATEYTYNNDDKSTASSIHGVSSVAIHLINAPLRTK